MESVMTLVIEESEDVTLELLTPILGVLKKDKEVRCNLVGWICCTPCSEEFMWLTFMFVLEYSNYFSEVGGKSVGKMHRQG